MNVGMPSCVRNQPKVFDNTNYSGQCQRRWNPNDTNEYLSGSLARPIRRANSVEVLLFEEIDGRSIDDVVLTPAFSTPPPQRRSFSRLFSTYSSLSSPNQISKSYRHNRMDYQSTGSETDGGTPKVISIGPASQPITEHIGIVETSIEEAQPGLPNFSMTSHSCQGSPSSVQSSSTVHILTADEIDEPNLPQPIAFGVEDPSNQQNSPVKPRPQVRGSHSHPNSVFDLQLPLKRTSSSHSTSVDIPSRSDSSSSGDYMDLGFDSPQSEIIPGRKTEEVSPVQLVSSTIASIAPILTHAVGIVVCLCLAHQKWYITFYVCSFVDRISWDSSTEVIHESSLVCLYFVGCIPEFHASWNIAGYM